MRPAGLGVNGTVPKFVTLPALTEKVVGLLDRVTTDNRIDVVMLLPVWRAIGKPAGGDACAISLAEIAAVSWEALTNVVGLGEPLNMT